MDELRAVGTVLILMSAVLATGCVVAQSALARWWKTPAGRHTWAFQATLAVCLDLWALRLVLPDWEWFNLVRLVAFACVPAVLFWRLEIIIRTWQRARRQQQKESDRP